MIAKKKKKNFFRVPTVYMLSMSDESLTEKCFVGTS